MARASTVLIAEGGCRVKDKSLCLKCKYHGTAGSRIQDGTLQDIVCDYGAITGKSCLRRINGEIVDRRGNEIDSCKLFVEGKQVGRAKNSSYHVEKKIHRRMIDVNSERGKELPPKD